MHLQKLYDQKKSSPIGNFSDNEIILTEFTLRCQSLEMEIREMLQIRENYQKLTSKNDLISKSLLKLKEEYDFHKAELSKSLFNQKLASDKQQLLSRRKLNDFLEKRSHLEEYLKVSPFRLELEELINRNNNLQEQWRKVTHLLDLTKNQYEEIMSFLLKTFKMKVCEFCDTALRLKAVND